MLCENPGTVARALAGASMIFLGAVALVHGAAVQAQDESVTAQLAEVIRIREEQYARGERCNGAVERLETRLATLNAAKRKDLQAIADTEERLANNLRCVRASARRVGNADDDIVSIRQQYVDLTGASGAEVDSRLEQLRSRESTRAQLDFKVRSLERQLQKLAADPVGNATLITQKTSVLNGTRDDLAAMQDQIATISGQLQSVELAVTQEVQGEALLSWSTPTTRENGTPLAPGEIGGFEIYVLSESTGESAVIVIDDPLAVTHTVDGLTPDTYYFSISAFDSAGHYSQLSDVVSKTVT